LVCYAGKFQTFLICVCQSLFRMVKDMAASPTKSPSPSAEEVAAIALNEQGYLLQHKLANVLETPEPDGSFPHGWEIEAEEVPVSLSSELQTRIDLLLRHRPRDNNPWRAVVESKRASPDFKRWVFFGQTDRHPNPSHRKYYVERADLTASGWHHGSESPPPMNHTLWQHEGSKECEAFDFYLEAKIEPPQKQQRASATTSIEDALYQVTLGQAGLSCHLRRARELNFRLLPVVVTTAEVYAARFATAQVTLERGAVDPADLKLEPMDWLAVHYRVSDAVSQMCGFTTNLARDIGAHVALRQVRTVFVTRATHLQHFLAWLGKEFASRGFA
jgi:hypothetical protein